MLMKNANPEQLHNLKTSYEYLTSLEKMGTRFKVFSLMPKNEKQQYVPAGFIALNPDS